MSKTEFSMLFPDEENIYCPDPKDSISPGTIIGYTILVAQRCILLSEVKKSSVDSLIMDS